MFSLLRKAATPRWVLSPVTRMALITFAWNHRHEIFRWGRSLWEQLIGQGDVSPARAVRTGTLLYAIASDETLRNAKQLRKVTMDGDTVDLDVDDRWSELDRLVDRVWSVKGVRTVTVNGQVRRADAARTPQLST